MSQIIYHTWYRHYYAHLLLYAERLCGCPAIAADILQDVFLKAWENRNELMKIEKPDAWLHVVTRNKLMNHFQQEENKKKFLRQLQSTNMYQTSHDKLVEKEYRLFHKAAIEKLPKRQQEIYKLRFELGLKRHDIAKVLSISPFTVKNSLKRAKEVVRDAMKQVA